MEKSAVSILALAAFALLGSSCGDECFGVASCIPDVAIFVTLSPSPGGGPISDATIQVSGTTTATVPCSLQGNDAMCVVYGGAGTYVLTVSAPGYQSVQRTATVGTQKGHCGCGTVATLSVRIALQRTP